MPEYVAVSRQTHAAKRWKRPQDFRFAAAQTAVPLVFRELPFAMMTLPLAFVPQGDGYALAAILGVRTGENLLVAPDGRWIGPYIPAAFRSWPFMLAPAEAGQQALCIARDCGLVVDQPAEGSLLFFGADGAPAKELAEIVTFLQNVSADTQATQRICAVLKEHGLIEPWPVTLPGDGRQLTGLNRINEAALNALPADALVKVRDCGGLALAYGQLLSMNHLHLLVRLAAAKTAAQNAMSKMPMTPSGELNLEFLNDSPTVNFNKGG